MMYRIRRRPRECKTCLPCRANKVRCDHNAPCGNCVKRNFTCSYGRPPLQPPVYSHTSWTASSSPSQTQSSALPYPGHGASFVDQPSGAARDQQDDLPEVVHISQAEWDEIKAKMAAMEQVVGSLHSIFQAHPGPKPRDRQSDESSRVREISVRLEGVYGPKVHFGPRSALVDILDKSKRSGDMAQALSRDDLRADLVLGNESAAYPFVDLWSPDKFTFNITDVCGVLPDDEQCHR